MSTYLVAFVVCDFVLVQGVTKHNVNVSVIASKDKIGQGQYALDTATALMEHYTDYFSVKYPLPKQGKPRSEMPPLLGCPKTITVQAIMRQRQQKYYPKQCHCKQCQLQILADLIAIPDFPAGAMENWGLITYRETSLLFSPKETSVEGKQNIAVVVAHELAHQWFGNLVTMQ